MISLNAQRAFGILATLEDGEQLNLSAGGHSAPNARYPSAVLMMRTLLEARRRRAIAPDPERGLYLFQFDDHIHHQIRSVALGRVVGTAPFTELIVDPYFFFNNGYAELRALSAAGALPPWAEREDILFWRGRGSSNGFMTNGERVHSVEVIPRIQLALRLRDNPHADVGIIGPWNEQPEAETLAYLARERILQPSVSMAEHARYRYQIDIDGVANAWATVERFLCGSCVLKVGSPFEMWFYRSMRAWTHYVPVEPDFADLEEKLDWCRAHPDDARAIAEAGRELALSLTYEAAVDLSVRALSACRIPVGA